MPGLRPHSSTDRRAAVGHPAWRPVLGGDLAAAARQSVERVAGVLLTELVDAPPKFDLPGGAAGHALTFAYLARSLGRADLREAASAAWDLTLNILARSDSTAALYGGFCGPAWVAAHLAREALAGPVEDEVFEQVDGVLLALLAQSSPDIDFDLISGLTGIGLYALERYPHGHAARVVELVIAHLLAQARTVEDGVTWQTPPERLNAPKRAANPEGYFNLGVAHGVPAPLAFLARAGRAGLLPDAGIRVLEGGVHWLLRQAGPEGSLRYGPWVPVGEHSEAPQAARLAWCYGDLGIAATLRVAGRCHRREDWIAEARRLARGAAQVAFEQSRINDHGLCHGAAGAAVLFARLGVECADEPLREAARRWFAKLLDMRLENAGIDGYAYWKPQDPNVRPKGAWNGSYQRDAGWLTGAAGVALALSAGLDPYAPSWDRVLLVSE